MGGGAKRKTSGVGSSVWKGRRFNQGSNKINSRRRRSAKNEEKSGEKINKRRGNSCSGTRGG